MAQDMECAKKYGGRCGAGFKVDVFSKKSAANQEDDHGNLNRRFYSVESVSEQSGIVLPTRLDLSTLF